MKRFAPLIAAVAALTVVAVIAVVAVRAGSGGSDPATNRQSEDTGDVAAACLEGATDCDDTVEGDDARCAAEAADCVDTPPDGGSMNMCIAEDDPAADPAAPECNDMPDSTARCISVDNPGGEPAVVPECDDTLDCTTPGNPGCSDLPAVDPICIDDGSGECLDTPGEAPPSGPSETYDLTVVFNDTVTQAGLDEVAATIEEIAPGTDVLIRESFPPVGSARITTDMAAFCPDIEAKFESLSYVSGVTCSVATDAPPVGDPDEPVSSNPSGGTE